jgi:hypothetical protein
MYKSSLRYIHDPVLSSLNMKDILSFSKELEELQETSSSERLETGRRHLPASTTISSPTDHADICGCVLSFPLNI